MNYCGPFKIFIDSSISILFVFRLFIVSKRACELRLYIFHSRANDNEKKNPFQRSDEAVLVEALDFSQRRDEGKRRNRDEMMTSRGADDPKNSCGFS